MYVRMCVCSEKIFFFVLNMCVFLCVSKVLCLCDFTRSLGLEWCDDNICGAGGTRMEEKCLQCNKS